MADERLLSRMGIAAQRQAIAGANVFAGVAGDQEASCREAIGLTNALPVIQRAGCSSAESCDQHRTAGTTSTAGATWPECQERSLDEGPGP